MDFRMRFRSSSICLCCCTRFGQTQNTSRMRTMQVFIRTVLHYHADDTASDQHQDAFEREAITSLFERLAEPGKDGEQPSCSWRRLETVDRPCLFH